MTKPLEGLLVISIDQAVAAPYAASRLADAGARVIKIGRPGGDFARGYDGFAGGESAYFVWLNRGKESIELDFKSADDLALLKRMTPVEEDLEVVSSEGRIAARQEVIVPVDAGATRDVPKLGRIV